MVDSRGVLAGKLNEGNSTGGKRGADLVELPDGELLLGTGGSG